MARTGCVRTPLLLDLEDVVWIFGTRLRANAARWMQDGAIRRWGDGYLTSIAFCATSSGGEAPLSSSWIALIASGSSGGRAGRNGSGVAMHRRGLSIGVCGTP